MTVRFLQRAAPRPDTALEILDRQCRYAASDQARTDREQRFPLLTAANVVDAIQFEHAQYLAHYAALLQEKA